MTVSPVSALNVENSYSAMKKSRIIPRKLPDCGTYGETITHNWEDLYPSTVDGQTLWD
jgi:hypothetical protein